MVNCKDLSIQWKTSLLALSYILDLGSCDMNYDVRDRSRMLKQIMGPHIKATSQDVLQMLNVILVKPVDEEALKNLAMVLPSYVFGSEKPVSSNISISQDRMFLLGSMSHIVNHCAPGYRPLPLPCILKDVDQSSLHTSDSEGIPAMKELIDEESDYSCNTGSDSDDDPRLKGYCSDNGLIHSNISDNGSISSNEESKNITSPHRNARSAKHLDEVKLISLSDYEEDTSTAIIGCEQGYKDESESKMIRHLEGIRNEPLIILSHNEEETFHFISGS